MPDITLHISPKAYKELRTAMKARRLACVQAGMQETILEKMLESIERDEDQCLIAYKTEVDYIAKYSSSDPPEAVGGTNSPKEGYRVG